MTILYKKDSKGKIRILKICTEGPDVIQQSGLLDSEKLVTHRKTCIPKNVGKTNETTGENQAISEMNSIITDKLTKGYFTDQRAAETELVVLPMLALCYPDEKHKIDWSRNDTYGQTKCDGQCGLSFIIGNTVNLLSRDGKPITTLKHIEQSLSAIDDNVILHGELYAHGYSFNENMKLIKKYRAGETEKVIFHIYDIVSNKPYSERKEMIKKYKDLPYVEIIDSIPIKSEEDLLELHSKFLSEGYEGTIVRHGDAGYKKNSRSSNLLKFKDFDDIALVLLDVVPADQRPEWGVPQFYWKGAKNDTLEAGTKMTHEERIDLLKNKDKYIGKTAELRFFGYSDKGVPRQPIMEGFRNDK